MSKITTIWSHDMEVFRFQILCKQQKGMALILTLILLAILMVVVASFSNVVTKSSQISQSGLNFRTNFKEQMSLNLIANRFIYNKHLQLSGLFSSEYLFKKSDFNWQDLVCQFMIKNENISQENDKNIGALLYKLENFVPGNQINSGGGKGTQSYIIKHLQTYTTCKTNNEQNVLTFRNWIEKIVPNK